jgi:hypothetical protein
MVGLSDRAASRPGAPPSACRGVVDTTVPDGRHNPHSAPALRARRHPPQGPPELLILDEPANGLDPPRMRDLRLLLTRLGNQGRPKSSPATCSARSSRCATRVAIVSWGKLIASGPVVDVLRGGPTGVHVQLAPGGPWACP